MTNSLLKSAALAAAVLTHAPAALAGGGGFEKTGDILQFGVPLGALFYSAVKGDTEGMRQLGESCLSTSLVVEGMKKSFNGTAVGTRPNGGPNNFPSGHAAGAYCGAAYLKERYSFQEALPAYILATAVGMSRIHAHKHTPLATGVSFVVTALVASELVSRQNGKEEKSDNLRILPMVPVPTGQGTDMRYGIMIHYKF